MKERTNQIDIRTLWRVVGEMSEISHRVNHFCDCGVEGRVTALDWHGKVYCPMHILYRLESIQIGKSIQRVHTVLKFLYKRLLDSPMSPSKILSILLYTARCMLND